MKKLLVSKYILGKNICKRILFIKLLFVLLFTGSLQLSASVYSQNIRIDINVNNAHVKEVIKQIRRNTEYTFVYNLEDLNLVEKVTLKIKDATVEHVLNECFKNTSITYSIKGKVIVLKLDPKKSNNKIITVKGRVLDKCTGKGIDDVNIFVKETLEGSVTDKDGHFKIKAKKNQVIILSRIGYETVMRKITKDTITVMMEKHVEALNEVVVRSKTNINDIDMRKIAGSIEVVDMKKVADRPEMDLSMMLQGQVPGLVVTSSGELGSKPKVRIRGTSSFRKGDASNEPLYVLDGMVISSEAFLTINPEDVEQVKVLKDAAASALYGIKGANGVIEITSKRGFEGKTQVIYRNKTGITFRGSRGVEMMDSKEKLELERLIQNPTTPGYMYSEDYYRKYYSSYPDLEGLIASGNRILDSLRNINTDWFKELIKMNTYQSHSIGIRGGTDKNQYYYSLNYSKQGGRIEGNDIKRFTGRMNLDYNVLPKLYVSFNVTAGYSVTNTPNGSSDDPTSLVYNLNPYEQKFDPKTGISSELYSFPNRRYTDLINQYSDKSTSKRFESSINSNWTLFEGFDLSAIVGMDYLLWESLKITPSNAYSQINYSEEEKGEIRKDKNTELNYSSNFRLNYNKVLGKHDITFGANMDYYFTSYDDIGLTGYGIASKVNTAAGINQGLEGQRKTKVRSRKEKSAQMGFGVALGYSYNSIYDLYGSYKADASSLLPSDKRWNTAWSVGCGWQIGGYSIFENAKFLTDLRLRASYGCTASLAGVPTSSAVPTYGYSQDVYSKMRIFDLKQFYNDDLRPEQTKTTNIGLNFEFFKKVGLSIDAYKRETVDALLSVPIPGSNGYTVMNRNVGILENSGLEFIIKGSIICKDNFTWSSSFSVSWNANKVVDLYDGDKLFISDGLIPEMEVGEPLGVIYGLESLGIHSIDGLPRFLSKTGSELTYKDELTREDFVMLGYSTPPYSGFFNNMFTYNNFDLSFDFYFSFGGKQKYNRSYVRDSESVKYNAVKGQAKDMWFKIGDENKLYYAPNLPSAAYDILAHPSSKTVYKTDFLRLNNIRLTYRVPHKLLQKMGNFISYANFNVQAQNIFTIRACEDKASLNGVLQPVLTFGANITF